MRLIEGDCLRVMPTLEADSVDAIITDPPYGLSFMGKNWDRGVPGEAFWREALRVAKPGCHMLAFGGTRTFHRLTCAIEDAGWEIRDCVMWVYGSGFPKSLDVSKAIDKAAGVAFRAKPASGVGFMNPAGKGGYNPTINQLEIVGKSTAPARQWQGWGTALKPAWEPIILARKPVIGTVAANVQKYGTGAINIEGCRIGVEQRTYGGMSANKPAVGTFRDDKWMPRDIEITVQGRFPANLIHDGSDAVDGMGEASRYFYCAKASKADRDEGCDRLVRKTPGECTDRKDNTAGLNSPRAGAGRTNGMRNNHPTVKPAALMRYLCKLITPPQGVILDPFMGSGSTGKAAMLEGFDFIGIELEPQYLAIAEARINAVSKQAKMQYA